MIPLRPGTATGGGHAWWREPGVPL